VRALLSVRVPPVPDSHDPNCPCRVGNLVDDPIGTNPDAPITLGPGNLSASRRSGVARQGLYRGDDPVELLGG